MAPESSRALKHKSACKKETRKSAFKGQTRLLSSGKVAAPSTWIYSQVTQLLLHNITPLYYKKVSQPLARKGYASCLATYTPNRTVLQQHDTWPHTIQTTVTPSQRNAWPNNIYCTAAECLAICTPENSDTLAAQCLATNTQKISALQMSTLLPRLSYPKILIWLDGFVIRFGV